MKCKLGTRIPPILYQQGIQYVAKWASEVGIEVLDVPALTPEIKKSCGDSGIEIGTVDAHFLGQLLSKDKKRRNEALDRSKRQISETSSLGGNKMFMLLVPEDPNLTRSEGFAIWREVFTELVKHAEREDVYFAIEGWPGSAPQYNALGCTPEMLRAMFQAIPSRHLGLNYDPSHLIRLGIDYLRFLREFGNKVIHCHGKDTEILHEDLYEYGILPATFEPKYKFSEGSWRYTIPGHGETQWNNIAMELEAIGYKGAVSIELEDHQFWGTAEAEIKGIIKSLQHLKLYFN